MELNPIDLNWCVRLLPNKLRELIKHEEIIVSGGYIRACIAKESISDIDLFTYSKEYAAELALQLSDNKKEKLYTTNNAITIRTLQYPLQFITRWTFDSPSLVVNSFDFTICQAAFWWDHYCQKWCSIVSPSFYSDLAAKRLVYTIPIREEEPGGSMLRILKYYQRGYKVPLDSLAKIIARTVGKIYIDKENMLNKEGYIKEDALFPIIRGLLYEVDPLIDPDHLLH